jgi:hypothetical protein
VSKTITFEWKRGYLQDCKIDGNKNYSGLKLIILNIITAGVEFNENIKGLNYTDSNMN